MAYGNSNPGPKEADDMLSDSSTEESSDGTKPKAEEEQTALVPEALCPGMKPGDEMVVKILEVQEDQYLIGYAPEKGHDEESEPDSSKESSGDKEMNSYLS